MIRNAMDIKDFLFDCRHSLHKIPELRDDLPLTVDFVTKILDECEINYEIIEHAGILATIGSGQKSLLLRGDMDGLPIKEESGEPFSSTNENMHACGHDMHTTMLLGAAKMLKSMETKLDGRVILFFQFNEEGMGGVRALIKSGYLNDKNVRGAMALHVLPGGDMVPGTFSCLPGPANSSVDYFRIKIKGNKVHGAMQYKGIDPINAGVQIYNSFSNVISKEIDAREFAVASICYFNAGDKSSFNTIPDYAELSGTLRTYNNETSQHLKKRLLVIANSIANANRTECQVEIPASAPSCVNDDHMVDLVNASAKEYGMINKKLNPQLVSDDFGLFSEMYPSVYVWIGASGNEDKYKKGVLHSSYVCMNDELLPFGTNLLVETARRFFESDNTYDKSGGFYESEN
jgi:amidohydrolase